MSDSQAFEAECFWEKEQLELKKDLLVSEPPHVRDMYKH